MTALLIRIDRRYYRPGVASIGFWLCFSGLMFINALTTLAGL